MFLLISGAKLDTNCADILHVKSCFIKNEHFSENAHFKYAHLSFLSYKYAQLE